MAIHPADKAHGRNPRLQCVCCARWMRLHGKRLEVVNGEVKEVAFQRFYGGCDYTDGGDHAAAKNGDNDVCEVCCHVECKRIAGCDCQNPMPPSGAAGVSEGCPVHGKLWATAPH